MTALIFGNVVIESSMMGSQVRIYSRDLRSYYYRPSPHSDVSVSLDDLREQLQPEHVNDFVDAVFDPVESELEANYSGGIDGAKRELIAWLLSRESDSAG